jgi:4-amino-4-deoxy-L-arabinose transferase-like glycosyltransferase
MPAASSRGVTVPFQATRKHHAASRIALLVLVGAAGLVLRVWVDHSAIGTPDSDEAVMGLMVRHALHGHLTTFYWGQPYGGSQEVLLTVPLFAVFGSSYTALRVVPIALSALAAVLVWRLGRRTVGEPAAALAGALMWVWFPESLVHLSHQYGFYASSVVYSALVLLLVLRVVEHPDRVRVATLGLVLGLAFWESVQIVPVAVPALLWAAWKEPRALRHAWIGTCCAVVGALPWLVWNVRHDWASLMARATAHEYVHSLRLFASPLLPMTLGLRAPLTGELVVPSKILVTLVYAILLVLVVAGALRYRRVATSLFFATFIAFPFVWAVSRRVTFLSATPRFLIVLTPVIALLAAHLGRRAVPAVAIAAAALAVSAISVQRIDNDTKAVHPHGIPLVQRNLRPLVDTLEHAGVTHVYADYWISYRLDFDSRERIVATELDPGNSWIRHGVVQRPSGLHPRSPGYARAVDTHRHGFVFFRRSTGEPLPRRLLQVGYRRVLTGEFAVYLPDLTKH